MTLNELRKRRSLIEIRLKTAEDRIQEGKISPEMSAELLQVSMYLSGVLLICDYIEHFAPAQD